MSGLRLNLGAGGVNAPGWVSVDRVVTLPGQMLLDLRDGWPWATGAADAVVLHHVLDLLSAEDMVAIIERCHRVLRPGGWLRVSGADLNLGVGRAIAEDREWFTQPRGSFDETVGFFITQAGARKQYLTNYGAYAALAKGGLTDRWHARFGETYGPTWLTDLDSRPEESWFVEARR